LFQLSDDILHIVADVEADLAQRFGANNVQGLARLVNREWIMAAHNDRDPGAVSSTAWQAQKVAMGAGERQTAFEMCQKAWKSDKVSDIVFENLLYTHLDPVCSPRTVAVEELSPLVA
jgi:hypothetical protein